jgi:hypothetical protein
MENKTKNGRSKEGNINRANAHQLLFQAPMAVKTIQTYKKRIKREI